MESGSGNSYNSHFCYSYKCLQINLITDYDHYVMCIDWQTDGRTDRQTNG